MVAAFVTVLTIGLVIWLLLTEKRVWIRRLAWIVLATVIVEALLGFVTVPQPPGVRFTHALLAHLFFATTVAMAVFTTRGWARIPELARCRLSVRILATITVILVPVQAALGVAFHHGVMDVTLHVLGALVVVIFVAALALSVLYRSGHEPLRPAGVTLLIVTALQVFLGLAVFSMGSPDIDPVAVIVVTMVHAATAALTLAATVVAAVLVLCSIPAGK
jgi:heme A synthase